MSSLMHDIPDIEAQESPAILQKLILHMIIGQINE